MNHTTSHYEAPDSFEESTRKMKKTKAGKGKNSSENAPIFLRKTYHMIATCDPTIATWSEDGLAFVVKDVEKFAANIIGQFFKHNNFSSFVRQLNFYGFRKIKSDPLRITEAENDVTSKYWKFRHEKFQRGRPDLLTEIRKSNHTEAADKQEVEALRSEVKDLKSKMCTMNQEMEKMANLIASIMQQNTSPVPSAPEPLHKKRRLASSNSFRNELIMPLPVGSDPLRKVSSVERGLLGANNIMPANVEIPSNSSKVSLGLGGPHRNPSVSSFTSTDEQILSTLFALDSTDDLNVFREPKPSSQQNFQYPQKKTSNDGEPDEGLMKKLRASISVLPKNLQEMFVERIVTFIANPETFKRQEEAVTSLAAAAAAEASRHVGELPVDPQRNYALASAFLGAWLAKYGPNNTSTGTETPKNSYMVTAPATQAPHPQVASVCTMAPAPM